MLEDLEVHLSPQRQASLFATGFMVVMVLGTMAAIGLCFVALWAIVQIATLLVVSLIECLTTASNLFANSPDIVKVIFLVVISYLFYRAGQHFLRRA